MPPGKLGSEKADRIISNAPRGDDEPAVLHGDPDNAPFSDILRNAALRSAAA
jgi:hypothetical protein